MSTLRPLSAIQCSASQCFNRIALMLLCWWAPTGPQRSSCTIKYVLINFPCTTQKLAEFIQTLWVNILLLLFFLASTLLNISISWQHWASISLSSNVQKGLLRVWHWLIKWALTWRQLSFDVKGTFHSIHLPECEWLVK